MKKIDTPESFADINIAQLHQLIALQERKVDRQQKLGHFIAIMHKIDYKEAIQIPLTKMLEIEADLLWVFQEPKIQPIKDSYKLGKYFYYPIKNLERMNAAQYIDSKTVTERGNTLQELHKLIGVFLLPYGKKYSNEVYEQTCEAVLNMDCESAFALQRFFFLLSNALTQDLPYYILTDQVAKAFKTLPLRNIGAGM